MNMNLRDVKRRDAIIVKRRKELEELRIQMERAKKLQEEREAKEAETERKRIAWQEERNKERAARLKARDKQREDLHRTQEEYYGYLDRGDIDRYAQMLLSPDDDYEMRDMKMKAIMEVMKGYRE